MIGRGKIPNAAAAEERSRPIYFLHIPKTAGTTLRHFIAGNFNEREVCPAHLWHNLLQRSPEEVAAYSFIWGHFYSYLYRYVNVPLRYLTLLRDPVERALSHYGHIVYYKEHYLHARAKELGSFGAFLRDPEMATTLTNFQVRALTNDLDPLAMAASLTEEELTGNMLERRLETSAPMLPDSEALLLAKLRLGQMCFVGITERLSGSVELLCEKFGWPFAGQIESHNLGLGRIAKAELSQADYALLLKFNEADFALYEHANRLMSEKIERSF